MASLRDDDASVPSTEEQEGGDALSFELTRADLQVGLKIGSGHTSNVYLGIFRGRQVAIKQLSMSKVNTRNFTREVGIMSQIQHPNIVQLLGIVLQSLPFQVVMEYCAGGTCFELLHNRPEVDLCWGQVLRMCSHAAIAMEYLHDFTPQIIHRDLKSLNLLLDRDVSSEADPILVKVTDFGLARMIESNDGHELQLTSGVGTPYWMAPEVFSSSSYNEKVDIYSYGMVVFEIICRKIPFEEIEPATAVRHYVLQGKTPAVLAPAGCPPELGDLMQSCWAFDPAARPPFCEILRILRAVECQDPNAIVML